MRTCAILAATLCILAPVGATGPDPAGTLVCSAPREATILWQRHMDDAIYTSTGLSAPAEVVLAGTEFDLPTHVEATPLFGDGTADWTHDGHELYVDASRHGEVLAAVDFNAADSTATIMEWRPEAATPLWSHVVHPCRSLVYQGWASRKPIQVSDDGSTIAAAIVMYMPAGQTGRLYVFDAGNGTPDVSYDFPTGNVVATAISAGGDYVAMAGWPNVYVYDRAAHALRWSGPIYSGNDALAISGDGRYLAWGWTTFYLREWNGATYDLLWSHSPGGGAYVGQCALTTDESTLAVSWDNGSSVPNEISVELYALPALDLLWGYDYVPAPARGARDHVDMAAQMVFAPDGEHLAVASWGGTFPEIHVFECAAPQPIFTLDTPGSIFDVDIAGTPGGNVYVTACGKAVHAGQGGRGGDLYAIEIPGSAAGPGDQDAPHLAFGLESIAPNPVSAGTHVVYRLAGPGPLRLTVHDPAGRLVRHLASGFGREGLHRVAWSGTDDAGTALPTGVYLVKLESSGRHSTRKALFAR